MWEKKDKNNQTKNICLQDCELMETTTKILKHFLKYFF